MADRSWVGITNVHLLQELACFQIPAVGGKTNSGCMSILSLVFSNHSCKPMHYKTDIFGFTETKLKHNKRPQGEM